MSLAIRESCNASQREDAAHKAGNQPPTTNSWSGALLPLFAKLAANKVIDVPMRSIAGFCVASSRVFLCLRKLRGD
jgi:hypothetical protein